MMYSPDCVPEVFSLSNPDHLTGFKISNLYHHWLAHQRKKLQPFIVINPGPLHEMLVRKSKKSKMKKKEYVPVSSDEDKSATGSDGEGGETKENELKDQCEPLPKFGPPHRKPQTIASSS